MFFSYYLFVLHENEIEIKTSINNEITKHQQFSKTNYRQLIILTN